MSMQGKRRRKRRAVAVLSLLGSAAIAVMVATTASAHLAAAPQNQTAPAITGQAQEGKTLTASNGTWSNSPTSFAYQWQQCDNSNCTNISGATQKTYTVAASDADKALRVQVTASNADGNAAATSKMTDLVSSKGGPTNTAAPTITGTPKVGEELDVSTGTWTGGVRSYSYQWQRCDAQGGACVSVPDATAKSYGVRSADVGNTLRVVVTATNLSGTTNAVSSPTALVGSNVPVTPTTTTSVNKAPTIKYISLKRVGGRIYARFSLCDDSSKNVTVIERDFMPGRLGYVRRFSVAPICGTQSRNWMLIQRFHHAGRFTSTLRAVDKSGKSSRTVSRSVFFNSGL